MAEVSGTQELRGILDQTTVGTLPRSGYPVLAAGDSLIDAIHKMRTARHGSAVVCEENRVIGIFTERDFLRVLAAGATESSVGEVMTRDPRTVTTDDSLLTAVRLMDEGGYRRLPVVEQDGRPAGVLDVKTVSHFIVEHFPEAVYNQTALAQRIARNREGA